MAPIDKRLNFVAFPRDILRAGLKAFGRGACGPRGWLAGLALGLAVLWSGTADGQGLQPNLNVGLNIDVSKLKGNESDAVIAINPQNTKQLFIAGDTNVNSVASAGLFGRYSINSGTTWLASSLTNLPAGAYPAVAWDNYGNLFLAYVDGFFMGTDLAVSTNGGVSFNLVTNLASTNTTLEPRIAVGSGSTNGIALGSSPTNGNGATNGSLWVFYKDYSLAYSPLVAQGVPVTGLGSIGSFRLSPMEFVPGSTNNCGFGDIAIGSNGQVMVAYQDTVTSPGPASVFVSLDPDGLGTNGFRAPVLVTTNAIGGNTLIPAQPNGQGINASAGLAWDKDPLSSHFGRLYLGFTGQGAGGADDTDIFLSYSDNNGSSWSLGKLVNDDGGANSQFLPRIAADPGDGAVALCWYDCRNDNGAVVVPVSLQLTNVTTDTNTGQLITNITTTNFFITNMSGTVDSVPNNDAQMYATVSVDGGFSFAPDQMITGTNFTTNAYESFLAVSPSDFGDYIGLAFCGGVFYPVWADNSGSAGANPDGKTNKFDTTVTAVTLTGVADLSITVKLTNTVPPYTVAPLQLGANANYFITVSNGGPSVVKTVLVTNIFSPDVNVIPLFLYPSQGNCSVNLNTLTWPVGTLAVGGTATLLARTPVVRADNITNVASVGASDAVDLLTNNNFFVLVSPVLSPDLALTMTGSPSIIGYQKPQVVYTLTVTNLGPVSATGVDISNTLPAILSLSGLILPPGATCVTNQNNFLFQLGSLATNSSATVTMIGTALNDGLATNFAVTYDSVIDSNFLNNTAAVLTQVVPPVLAVGMSGAPGLIGYELPTVVYTLGVTNTGLVPAIGVTIVDTMTTNLTFSAVTLTQGTFTNNQNVTTFNLGELDVGSNATVTLTAIGNYTGLSTNFAVVSDFLGDVNYPMQVETPIVPPGLSVSMSGTPSVIGYERPEVTYTLIVSNTGAVPAIGVTVSNTLSTNLTLSGLTLPPGAVCGTNQNGYLFQIGNLFVNSNATLTMTAYANYTGPATNFAVVSDQLADMNVTTQVVTPVTPPGLSVTMTGSPLVIGYQLPPVTYTLSISNTGPVPAIGVTVSNYLENLNLTGASLSQGSFLGTNGNELDIEIGDLEIGSNATVTITGTGQADGEASSLALISDFLGDTYYYTNVFTAIDPPGLAVAMTALPPLLTVGQMVTNLLTVSNAGPIPVIGLSVCHTLATNLVFTGATLPQGTFNNNLNVTTFNLGELDPGSNATVSIIAAAQSVGQATNTSWVYDFLDDINYTNQLVIPVLAPDLALGMVGSPSTLPVGQPVTYTLSVTNLGPVPAAAVGVSNLLPSSLVLTGVTVSQGSYSTAQNVILCSLGSLTNGQTATVNITATPQSTGKVTNTAVVYDSLVDTNLANNSAQVVTRVTNAPVPFHLTVNAGITGAFISWDTPYNATAQVAYGLTTAYGNVSWLNPGPATHHVVMLTGLLPDTNYFFQARSITSGLLSTTNGSFATTSSLIMNTQDASYSGLWSADNQAAGIFGSYYQFSVGTAGDKPASATYTPNIPVTGTYDVSLWYPTKAGAASNTPVTITGATNAVFTNVNQTIHGGSWQLMAAGMYFAQGAGGTLVIDNNIGGTNNSVVANAVKWAYNVSQDNPANGAVPAWWAEFYFGANVAGSADADGDGYSNYAEYVLGTCPTNSSDHLQFWAGAGASGNVTVTFAPYQGGRVYQLQSTANAANPSWLTLTNTVSATTNGTGLFTVSNAGGAALFYRLSASQSP
jgi:uncharacterized repeat protein (TIGR01451 family)